MSTSDPPPANAAGNTPGPPPEGRPRKGPDWFSRLLLWGSGLVLMGVVVFQLLPREISRWYQAAALVHGDHGEWEEAVRSLDRALAYDDRHPGVYAQRGSLRVQAAEAQYEAAALAAGQALEAEEITPEEAAVAIAERQANLDAALEAALADYETALELYPGQSAMKLQRAEILQRLGRHEEAIEICSAVLEEALQQDAAEQSNPLTKLQLADARNTRAYVRARGGVDLEEALEEINLALAEQAEGQHLLELMGYGPPDLTYLPIFLDTRGYIYYQMGEYDKALVDMEIAVDGARELFASRWRRLNWEREMTHNQEAFDGQVEMLRHNLAVILYHRGQVYEAIGRHDAAQRDFEEARAYGYSEELGVW